MTKWEYRTREIEPLKNGAVRVRGSEARETGLAPFLMTEGADGWELVQLWPNPVTGLTEAVFKRPAVTANAGRV